MLRGLYPLLGVTVTVLSSTALGAIFLRRLGLPLTRAERRVFAFLTGAAWLSLVVLALSALHLAYKAVFYALTGVLLALLWLTRNTWKNPPEKESSRTPRAMALLAVAVALPFLVLYFCTAWAPEVSPDGSSYHLGNVLRLADNRGLVPIRDMYGALPEGLEMLFLYAFSIGRHASAALVHFVFLLVLPFLLVCYGKRVGFPKAGILAAVIVFVSPLFGIDGASAYNDVALAASAFGMFYLIDLWLEQGDDRFLIPAGLLAGFCFGIKYTGAVAVFYGLGQIAFRLFRKRHFRWAAIALFSLPCLVMIVPWLVKNAIYMHNPLSPFFNAFFPNPYVSPRFERDYTKLMAAFAHAKNTWDLIWQFSVTGTNVEGFLGPVFLLSPLALGSLREKAGWRLLLAAILFAAPVLTNQGTRFLMPAAPFLAMALAMGVANAKFVAPALLLLHGLLSWPGLASSYCSPGVWRLSARLPSAAALKANHAESYLRAHLFMYDLIRAIDQLTPPGSKIFCFTCPPYAYMTRDTSKSYETLLSTVLHDAQRVPLEEFRQPLKRITFVFPRTSLTGVRVELSNPGGETIWNVHELRVFEGTQELRSPSWRLAARPDPWEAPFAFDNSPVTQWSTEGYASRGAFLEVRFDRPTAIDSVALDEPRDGQEALTLWGETASNDRVALNASKRSVPQPPPAGMRRAAILIAEAHGYQYLSILDSDFYAEDYDENAPYWGMRAIARGAGWTLYHLE